MSKIIVVNEIYHETHMDLKIMTSQSSNYTRVYGIKRAKNNFQYTLKFTELN